MKTKRVRLELFDGSKVELNPAGYVTKVTRYGKNTYFDGKSILIQHLYYQSGLNKVKLAITPLVHDEIQPEFLAHSKEHGMLLSRRRYPRYGIVSVQDTDEVYLSKYTRGVVKITIVEVYA